MKTQRQISDFAFGAIAVAAAPVIVFALCSVLIQHISIPYAREPLGQMIILYFIPALFIFAPLVAISFVVRWRLKHRQLPVWMLWLEVPIGLVTAAAFYWFVEWVWFYPNLTW
jgi:hypothetical protein